MELTQAALSQFTGSEQFFRHGLVRGVVYTEGAQFVAEAGEAYWLLDKIATGQLDSRLRNEPFQVWKLQVHANRRATLTVEDGDCYTLLTEAIEYTDFPLEEITLWCVNGTIMLPREY